MFNYLKATQINLSWLLVIFLIVVGITAFPQQVLADEDEDDEDPPKDLVLKGDARCTVCHDENSDKPILAIGKTKHGTVADHRTPTCTSCHGDGGSHEESPDKALMPQRTFGKHSHNPIE
jgi:cytochrome c553